MTIRPLAFTALSAALLAVGCDPSAPSDPQPTPPSGAVLSGTYAVVSHVSVPATAAAPGPLGDAVGLLHELAVNPAGGLLDLAEAAGTPALSELRLLLPGELEDRLEGWMNDYLKPASAGDTTPYAGIAALDGRVRSVLLDWELRSTLTLPPEGAGTHAPDALVFSRDDRPIVVPVDETAPVTAATGVLGTVEWPSSGGAPTVSFGDHAMGLPFGHYALDGLGVLLERQYGSAEIGTVLAGIVGCDALASSVAAQCVEIAFLEVCVGNASLLREVCEAGVARGAEELQGRILALDFQAIRFASGSAVAEGADRDPSSDLATVTAMSGGSWEATVRIANEPQEATATFTASRVE